MTAPTDSPDAVTAFRVKEKQYQLHKQQQMKYRGGKLRGWKLVDRGTDFSGIVDLHSAPPSDPRIHQHSVAGCPCPVYTFDQHPGLVYLPLYLATSQQLELSRAAVQEYHEPPARTNHSVHHGPLPGLWEAAQAGLLLTSATGPAEGSLLLDLAGSSPPSGYAGTPPVMGHAPPAPIPPSAPASPLPAPVAGEAPARASTPCGAPNGAAGRSGGGQQASAGVPNTGADGHSDGPGARSGEVGDFSAGADSCSTSSSNGGCSSAGADGCSASGGVWSTEGDGPPAQRLLTKLRWATLGPPYNWTTRTYEHHAPHRPLPPFLRGLADDIATVFDHLAMPLVQPPEAPWPLPTRLTTSPTHKPHPPPAPATRRSSNPTGEPHASGPTQHAPPPATTAPDAATATTTTTTPPSTPIASPAEPHQPLAAPSTTAPLPEHHPPQPHHPQPNSATTAPSAAHPANPSSTAAPHPTSTNPDPIPHHASNQPPIPPSDTPSQPTPDATPHAHSDSAHARATVSSSPDPKPPKPYRQRTPYHPDAAIVNYYREGDTLGGHRDDAEASMAHPLLSVSLGCRAVFLMGGVTKAVLPTPLMLHSGDVLVLSGEARRCYHGVPRVLGGTLPQELRPDRVEEQYRAVSEYLMGGRINISVRTVT